MSSCEVSIFNGMTTQQLQSALTAAQNAYINLSSGSLGESFSYAQGDGTKSVTYTRAQIGNLMMLIRGLQKELGIIYRTRRPTRFIYR